MKLCSIRKLRCVKVGTYKPTHENVYLGHAPSPPRNKHLYIAGGIAYSNKRRQELKKQYAFVRKCNPVHNINPQAMDGFQHYLHVQERIHEQKVEAFITKTGIFS